MAGKLLPLDSDTAWERVATTALAAILPDAPLGERLEYLKRFRESFQQTLAQWRRDLELQGTEPPPARPRLQPAARARKRAFTHSKGG